MADIPKPDFFFPEIGDFEHADIFSGIERPWDVLPKIRDYVVAFLRGLKATDRLPDGLELLRGTGVESMLICEKPLSLKEDLYCRELEIFIGAGSKIEPTTVIKRYSIVGRECEMRQGVYLRGDIITGDFCTLGHATEIKSSIIMNHSEMGHFDYVGDSVIGSYVNIGAGTKLANLKFRLAVEKSRQAFPEITFSFGKKEVKTGLSKFGVIIGDYCETGCNSVLSPAVLLAPECWVYPNCTVPSGYYEPRTFIAPEKIKVKPRPLPR